MGVLKWGLTLMRTTYLRSLLLLLLCYSGVSNASTLSRWDLDWVSGIQSYSTYQTACQASPVISNSTLSYTQISSNKWRCTRTDNFGQGTVWTGTTSLIVSTCEFGDNGASCNVSCDAPKTMVNGQCIDPPPDPCLAGADTDTGWKKEWPSYDVYNSDPAKPKCQTSQNGCAVDICGASGSMQCGQSASTGTYACFGNGTYTGESQDSSEGGDVQGCEGAECEPPPPQSSDSDKNCTAPSVNGSTTTYTCQSESNSDQWSSSNCAVGTVNGVTGLHCTQPDYVPEADSKVVTDNVTQTTNPDGSVTTTTDTTTDRTTCKAGDCSTSSTTTTTTSTKDADGNTTSETTECQGDKCDNPATPEDESEEEEEVERTAEGGDCASALVCEGDAIDCAVLEQQKLMRCSMDWETQKGSVLAEAAKPEYAVETQERDVAGFFTGPSTARWLTASCPADRVIQLATTGTSITFSWDFVCQYASGLGNLLVALASLFFAVYVGRAFGGS